MKDEYSHVKNNRRVCDGFRERGAAVCVKDDKEEEVDYLFRGIFLETKISILKADKNSYMFKKLRNFSSVQF